MKSGAISSASPPATFADLADLPAERASEIVHGDVVRKASPSGAHANAQLGAASWLHRRFSRRSGGGAGPGGWWILTEPDVELAPHDLIRPDIAGFRRDHVPVRPDGWPIRDRPDWVCEVLSTSNARHDLVDKLLLLQTALVPHYWILDPEIKRLVVYRLVDGAFRIVVAARAPEVVRAEPFDALELPLAVAFGDEDED